MKQLQRIFITGMAVVLVFSLTACGASSAPQTAASSTAAYAEESEYDMMADPEVGAVMAEENSGAGAVMPVTVDPSRKLIRNVFLEMETKEYDALTKTVLEQISLAGGYIENSQMVGGAYVSNSASPDSYGTTGGSRYARIVARVPQDQVDPFIAALGEHGSIRNRQESVRDVTLEYVDVESHKKSLAIEYERLLALLEKADKLEAIVELESRLSEVRYQIESYESQLRAYDNQVNYSTVEISITEVERITPIIEERPTMGQRISAGLSTSLYRIGQNTQNFFVWFVVNLPYLVIWAVVIFLIVFAARKAAGKHTNAGQTPWRKKNEKKTKELPTAPTTADTIVPEEKNTD